MPLCNKYLGDDDGTCPQLTCILEKNHTGNCDNVGLPVGPLVGGTGSRTPPAIVDIFSARIKRALPDLTKLFEAYQDNVVEAELINYRVDESYQAIVGAINDVVISSADGVNPPPTLDQVMMWFKRQGIPPDQLNQLEQLVEAGGGRRKKTWHRALAEAITTGFLAILMENSDDEDDDVGGDGPRAG